MIVIKCNRLMSSVLFNRIFNRVKMDEVQLYVRQIYESFRNVNMSKVEMFY